MRDVYMNLYKAIFMVFVEIKNNLRLLKKH